MQEQLSEKYGPPSRTGESDSKDIPLNGVFCYALWRIGKKRLFVAAHHEDVGVPIILWLGSTA